MKRLYILIPLLLLFISATTYGQKIRFTDTVNNWKIQRTIWTPLHYDYTNSKYDSTIIRNGKNYVRIAYFGLCREDSLQKKVYVITPTDTVEKTLFDYNLQKGDTFEYQFSWLTSNNKKGVVMKTDSTLVAGNYYKTWEFQNIDLPNRNTVIIEGIGLLAWEGWDEEHNLVCFNRNGVMITIDYYKHVDSSSCVLDVSSISNDRSITISPNPANQYSKITFPYTIQWGQFTITDVLGKTVSSKSINNKTEIAIGELPASGFYFYQLTDLTQNQSYTGKFIYE